MNKFNGSSSLPLRALEIKYNFQLTIVFNFVFFFKFTFMIRQFKMQCFKGSALSEEKKTYFSFTLKEFSLNSSLSVVGMNWQDKQ